MVYNAAARCELIRRYYSGVVSRLCIRSLHAVVTVLFYARLNTHRVGQWLALKSGGLIVGWLVCREDCTQPKLLSRQTTLCQGLLYTPSQGL
jgi:hypothetical protein